MLLLVKKTFYKKAGDKPFFKNALLLYIFHMGNVKLFAEAAKVFVYMILQIRQARIVPTSEHASATGIAYKSFFTLV